MAKSNIDLLTQYLGQPPKTPGPNAADLAKYILLNAQTGKALGPGVESKSKPSLMGRIFDILSRGNYASAEFTRSTFNPEVNPIEAIWAGLSGKKKTTFADVIREQAPDSPKALQAVLGLGLDIAADPFTYVPLPIGKGIGKIGLGLLSKTPESLDKTLAQKILSKGEPIHPESFGLPTKVKIPAPKALQAKPKLELPVDSLRPKAGFDTAQPPLPGFEGKIPLPEITKTSKVERVLKEIPGQQALRFPDFSVKKATQIVEGVAKQDPESLLKVTPMPKPSVEPRHQAAADRILENWDHSRSTAELNKKFPDSLNAKQQVGLYYRALEEAKKSFKSPNAPANVKRVNALGYRIYNAIEKTLEARGLIPRIGTGENVRLSDVIRQLGGSERAKEVLDEFGSQIKQGSPTWQALQGLRAAGAIDESKTVQLIADKVLQVKAGTELPEVLTTGFEKFLKKFGEASAQASGLSPASTKATANIIDMILSSGKSQALIFTEQKAKILDEVVSNSRMSAEVNRAVTKGLERDLGRLPKWVVDDNKAVEFFMGRVATWWGQSDLRPLSLNAIGASSATAAARGHVLDQMFKGVPLPARYEAMQVAQGLTQANTPQTAFLAQQIKEIMESVVGQVSGRSVVLRSGVHLEMLNKWMRHYNAGFEFTKGKVKDFTGQVVDYSKGTDWLNSWKSVEVRQDPKLFLFKVQQAMEQATREKALFDELGERFGALVPGNSFRTKINGYAYIEDYYFTSDIAKQIPRVIKDWSLGEWTPKSPLLRHYDRVLSMWKSGVTIYRPGHHIRNLVGDIYLGWMDGVNSVRPYKLAAQVQKSMRGAYRDIADVDMLVDMGALGKSFKTPEPHQILFRNKSGVPFTAEQIAAVAHQKGLLEHTHTLEDIIDLGEQSRFKPLGGRAQHIARTASELNSHFSRLAHFIDKVGKSRGNNLEKIFEDASRRTRKWHPTGLDLTEFERKYLRRIMPFYSWLRKSTPLLIEGLVMNPGKAVVPAKIYDAIQVSQGIDTPGRDDPFPVDQMFPQWIRAQGTGPISTSTGFLGKFSNQVPTGYVMGGVGLNPLQDLVSQLETPGKTIGTSLTPGVQVPIELMSGRKLFTGEPITGTDARPGAFRQYIGEQIPWTAPIQSVTGFTPFGSETKKHAKTGGADTEALINWLTAAGIRGTGPYRAQGRYEALAPMRMRKKVGREEFLQELRKRLGE